MESPTADPTTPASQAQIISESRWRYIWRHIWQHNKGALFVAPAAALWILVGLYPVMFSISLSFHRWNGFGEFSLFPTYTCVEPGCRHVGLKYYEELLNWGTPPNKAFFNALGNNLIMMLSNTVGVITISLPLALAMNRATRGITIFRSLLLLPMVTAGIAVYYVWSLIYEPEGLLNAFFKAFGPEFLIVEDGWLGDINTALPALIIVMIWAGVPLAMLLYLAGLQTIPHEVVEAAIVDGAGAWERLRRIIWPLLRPVTVIIIITSLAGALQGYEMSLLMTDGGPTNHTMVVGLLVYKKAFGGWGSPAMGMASAYGWVLFILGLGLSIFSLRSMRTQT